MAFNIRLRSLLNGRTFPLFYSIVVATAHVDEVTFQSSTDPQVEPEGFFLFCLFKEGFYHLLARV